MSDEGAKRASGLDATHLADTAPPTDEDTATARNATTGRDDTVLAAPTGRDETLLATTPPAGRSSMPSIPPPVGQRYRLGAELGRGGMGRVVEAFDTHLGRAVALKEVLPKGGNIERRFQREVRITARLEHASIVPLYDSGVMPDGKPFYVMRRVTGRPLDELIGRARSIEERLALLPNVLAAIDAMAHAHKRGVIHRDLKPQNILVGELGETVVIDWGLAKVLGDDDEPIHDSLEPRLPSAADSLHTQIGSVFGTPGFMAPEQARGDELGPAGDVYALGATLYQLLAGRPPVGGNSATDVIVSTMRHKIVPIAKACPNAPPELVTIINKALAFEATDRYANAGELAEDVRRFLTGQLVGAHNYTRRQRLARFAKRHRAPLVVAALAAVGIAALSWFSVHRIVSERDTATQASIEARAARAQAEARAAEVRQRADQLLLLHARSLLESNPTQAVAVLKQFDPNSAAIEEARAIGRAAVMRGVAYGLPTLPDLTVAFEMTRDGKRLLHIDRRGNLQVLDLERRRVVLAHSVPGGSTGTWVDGDQQILVQPSKEAPSLLHVATKQLVPLGGERVRDASKTAAGDRVAIIDALDRLVVLDVATKQTQIIPTAKLQETVQIAPDGAWIAVVEEIGKRAYRVAVIDRTGKRLFERETDARLYAVSPTGKLAIATGTKILEVMPAVSPASVTEVPVDTLEAQMTHMLVYRGERLQIVSPRYLITWTGKHLFRHQGLTSLLIAAETHDGALAISSTDGHVTVMTDDLTHSLAMTSRPATIVRIAATAGGKYVVATARDAVLVWDVSQMVPRASQKSIVGAFANESLVVQPAGLSLEWIWWDIDRDTLVRHDMKAEPGLPQAGVDVGSTDGRVMVTLERATRTHSAVVGYPDGREVSVDGIAPRMVRMVEGDAIIYSPGRGRILGKIGTEEPRELVQLDSDVLSLAPAGKLAYAALSKTGELVRGHFDGSNFARTHLPDLSRFAFVAANEGTDILVASGNRLLSWGTDLLELARFTDEIERLLATPTGLVVTLTTNQMMFIPAKGDRTPRKLAVGDAPTLSNNGSRVISVNATNQLEIIELPSLAMWSLPKLSTNLPRFAISPSGRRVLHGLGMHAAMLQLPEPGSDFAAWLDELTNATADAHQLRWPWQQFAP